MRQLCRECYNILSNVIHKVYEENFLPIIIVTLAVKEIHGKLWRGERSIGGKYYSRGILLLLAIANKSSSDLVKLAMRDASNHKNDDDWAVPWMGASIPIRGCEVFDVLVLPPPNPNAPRPWDNKPRPALFNLAIGDSTYSIMFRGDEYLHLCPFFPVLPSAAQPTSLVLRLQGRNLLWSMCLPLCSLDARGYSQHGS